MANVHDMLRISGDLTLRGIPDEADAGSWVLLPPANLVGQGYLEFQVGSLANKEGSMCTRAGLYGVCLFTT